MSAAPGLAAPVLSAPVLSVQGLQVAYGRGSRQKQVIFDASLEIASGEVIGLIGETGSGKSTLARTVLGLVKATGGTVTFGGRDLTSLTPAQWREFRRTGALQYVFQDPMRSLDPEFTIEQSIAEPLVNAGGHSAAEIASRVREYLARVHLDESLLPRLPGQVSGGQRQRAAIARALVTEPALLILDEPVSALDSANRVQILELLQGLAGPSVSLLFISHDLGSVAGITDRVVVLYQGRIVEVNETDLIINEPKHPYTQLLVGSAPTLGGAASARATRDALRDRVEIE
ncbi:dipeptide/oligopeptide/nickel ABC transporter ATP-binding protein [Frondihabitans sp. PAMC 28766]|uniref:ABC transporter ATP-binding protein n=1 Tax=Frondihabitans sp. PAMC 28766 TaxID=1795630 RepID=UPI00078BD557|nr:ABC transporter ATP-binding protein [Frondihabitans sp. PAMC 28766]AMM22058.1 dipeptide/oligopeptide/nickel ABC transporter ATP-binding protein [Frondihabitans sp. PAMC 28766]